MIKLKLDQIINFLNEIKSTYINDQNILNKTKISTQQINQFQSQFEYNNENIVTNLHEKLKYEIDIRNNLINDLSNLKFQIIENINNLQKKFDKISNNLSLKDSFNDLNLKIDKNEYLNNNQIDPKDNLEYLLTDEKFENKQFKFDKNEILKQKNNLNEKNKENYYQYNYNRQINTILNTKDLEFDYKHEFYQSKRQKNQNNDFEDTKKYNNQSLKLKIEKDDSVQGFELRDIENTLNLINVDNIKENYKKSLNGLETINEDSKEYKRQSDIQQESKKQIESQLESQNQTELRMEFQPEFELQMELQPENDDENSNKNQSTPESFHKLNIKLDKKSFVSESPRKLTIDNNISEIKDYSEVNSRVSEQKDKSDSILSSQSLKTQSVKIQKIFTQKSEIIDELLFQDFKTSKVVKDMVNTYEQGGMIIDKDYTIVQTNNFITDYLLQERKKLLGIEFFSIIPHAYQLELQARFRELSNNQQSVNFITTFQDSNLNQMDLECFISQNEYAGVFLRFIQIKSQRYESYLLIEHKSNFYLAWMGLIAIILLFLLIQMPYDMVQGTGIVMDAVDIPLTIIFTLDLFINFNLTYDIDDDNIQRDRYLISMNQIKSWFIIDFISTVPLDLLFEVVSTQIFKSLKIFRVLRFVKLTRLLRLSKIQSVIKKLKTSNIKWIQYWFKQNQGYFDLLKNMFQIQVFAHFYSIGFYAVQFEICKIKHFCWLNFQKDTLQNENVSDQNFTLEQHIKVALGLGAIHSFNNFEIYINMMWQFIGLSLFGQGIGNISSQLNQANKQDLEQMEAINQFNELCLINDIDIRLQNIVVNNLEQNYSKYMDRELLNYSTSLSPHVFDQLENSLLEKFIHCFKMFEKLNVKTLRLIKHHMIIEKRKVLLKIDMTFKNLYLILDGSINIQDNNMNQVNYFETGEVFGVFEFFSYFKIKQGINVEKLIVANIEEQEEKAKSFMKGQLLNRLANLTTKTNLNSSILSTRSFKMIKNTEVNQTKDEVITLLKKIKNEFESNQKEFKQTISMNDDYLGYNFNAICTDDVKLMVIPFQIIEEILFTQNESIQYIYKYQNSYNRSITNEEQEISQKAINEFKYSNVPTLLIMQNGDIQDFNEELQDIVGTDKIDLNGMNIQEVVNNQNNVSKLLEQDNEQEQQIKINGKSVQCKINIDSSIKVIRYKHVMPQHLHKLSKSLIKLINFKIIFQEQDDS